MENEELAPKPPPPPVSTVDQVFPSKTNIYGTIFGGELVSMMDKLAFVACTRYWPKTWVTASMEAIDFRMPIKRGQVVELIARVVYAGGHTCMVKVDVFGEDPTSGERYHCCTGYLNFVALDVTGRPTRVPPLKVESEDEKREYERALEVRKATRERIARWREMESEGKGG